MKKCVFFWMLLLLLCCGVDALGESAPDLTSRCAITFASGSAGRNALSDPSYRTCFTGRYLDVEAPAAAPCQGLYICFSGRARPYQVLALDEKGEWIQVAQDDRCYVNSFVSLPPLTRLRIAPLHDNEFSITRLFVLGAGDIPSWVQDWRPFTGKADLMVLSAHADDELLFFGGVIPYYAAEKGKRVLVCYLTDQTPYRRNELLDGLWLCGVREYPIMGAFADIKNNSLGDSYDFWGKPEVLAYVAGLFRAYRPDVVLTHGLRGEYGHGAHRVCADAAVNGFALAADPAYLDIGGEPWQVKKLYLHLYAEAEIVFDWRQSLSVFGGRTAFDVVKIAFDCHASQKGDGWIVQDWGDYANNRFGLYASVVGQDELRNDLFEHLEAR